MLKARLGIAPKVSMAAPGMLDIFLDGRKIFSYKEAGHMPSDDEVLALLEARRSTGRP